MVVHSSLADFILFLYVHMANADNQYEPAELKAIQSKIQPLFAEGTDLEKKLYTTLRNYNQFNKADIPAIIEDSVHHFSEREDLPIQQIISDLQYIVQADGTVHTNELTVLNAFNRLLQTVTVKNNA